MSSRSNGNGHGNRDGKPDLKLYDPKDRFAGKIGKTAADSKPAWPRTPMPPAGAPNVLMIVLDDVGFAQIGCYGGLGGRIETPNIDRLASGGLRYTNFHTTALCSPSRAALLTGRNHHSVGVGTIMECATGYPGYNAQIPHEAAMLPAVLVERGYSTMCLGKWHLTPDEHNSAVGPYDRWPLGRGFERFYGFLPGENDQWSPDLWQDNTRIETPRREGYHLTEDLTDHAIEWITEQKAVAPDKPFFMYFAPGACHSPHHAPKAFIDRYQGRFDAGWDRIREETLTKQKQLGVVPAGTDLPTRNPGVEPWDALPEKAQRLFCRQMETFAGFLTHTDHHLGRLIDLIEKIGQLDNTIVMLVSDNGASGEGGPQGLSSEMSFFNMVPETLDDMYQVMDRWGQPGTHPHYATGWAMCGNTPQRWYKQQVHEGGTRDPFIVHWPSRIRGKGTVRTQFHHMIDVFPTLLEVLGLAMPKQVRGYKQMPLEGISLAYSFDSASAPTRKKLQYFEMLGHRALWQEGWKLVTFHRSTSSARGFGLPQPEHDLDFDADRWELYHLDEDFSESHDVAAQHPDRVKKMATAWWKEAERHHVLPLDDTLTERMAGAKPVVLQARDVYTYYAPTRFVRSASPDFKGRSHTIEADVEIPSGGAQGAIVSNGGPDGGFALGLKDGKVHYVSSYMGREFSIISSDEPLPTGEVRIRFEFDKVGGLSGVGRLYVNDHQVGEATIARTNPVVYAVTEGFEVGGDGTAPVWPEAPSPFTFTGKIVKVEVRLGTDKLPAPERQAEVAMYRQ